MSRAYPLMRGLAPALVADLRRRSSSASISAPVAWAGVALISGGVFGMTFASAAPPRARARARGPQRRRHRQLHADRRRRRPRLRRRRPPTRCGSSSSTPSRSSAGRSSPAAARLLAYAARNWRLGVAGGIGNLGSYGLALWAMTQAPVAIVAALRETSILFGMAIAALALGERSARPASPPPR